MHFSPKTPLIVLVSSLLCLSISCRQHKSGLNEETLQHILRIEKGLYPMFNIKGEEKARSIQELMLEKKIAGLSIAFVDHGKIAWTRCYGYADLKDSVKVTENTIFRAASLSKPLTAMAALHMVEEGKISLDADANKFLKGWTIPENEFTAQSKVTVAHLIGHRSGIKNDVHPMIENEGIPSLEEIFMGKTKNEAARVISVPGEKYKYSNVGYMVLSELLADVYSRPFETIMDELVLKPCAMKSSTFNQELPASFKKRAAVGHDENLKAFPFYKHASYGAGALWTTPSDLGLFLAEILGTYHNKNSNVISHEMALKVFATNREKLGFNKHFDDSNLVVRNDGSIFGFNCIMMASVTKNQAVVLMLNSESEEAYDFLNYLWRAVSYEYNWGLFEPEFYGRMELPEDKLRAFEGTYSRDKDILNFNLRNKNLELNSEKYGSGTLTAVGKSSFLIPEIPLRLGFQRDSSGTVRKLYIRNERGDEEAPYEKVK